MLSVFDSSLPWLEIISAAVLGFGAWFAYWFKQRSKTQQADAEEATPHTFDDSEQDENDDDADKLDLEIDDSDRDLRVLADSNASLRDRLQR